MAIAMNKKADITHKGGFGNLNLYLSNKRASNKSITISIAAGPPEEPRGSLISCPMTMETKIDPNINLDRFNLGVESNISRNSIGVSGSVSGDYRDSI